MISTSIILEHGIYDINAISENEEDTGNCDDKCNGKVCYKYADCRYRTYFSFDSLIKLNPCILTECYQYSVMPC